MKWDKNKIETDLFDLSQRISRVTQEPLFTSLKYDYEILLNVLKFIDYDRYIYFQGLLPLNEEDYSKYYLKFKEESLKAIIKNKDFLFELIKLCETYNFNKPKISMPRTITEDLYIESLRVFFKNFSKEFYDLFLTLVDEDRIYFTSIGKAKGACYYTVTTQQAYLLTNLNLRNSIGTLPHEVAHAYEFSLIPDFERKVSWHFSAFAESYPRFIQFAFLDFLIDNFQECNYKYFFLEKKREMFDELKALCEYCVCTNNIEDNEELISFIISDFIAIYMYHLYKSDKDALNDFLKKYHNLKGIDDQLIWDLLNIEELKTAFFEESKQFNLEVELSRKRKKSTTFQ